MFPYIGLATLPIFCEADWPKQLKEKIKNVFNKETPKRNFAIPTSENEHGKWKRYFIVFTIFSYCGIQCFLPFSHFITKGYNNWTNGLYGYSWDMMVHSWDTILVVVRVVDGRTGKEHFLDPEAWVQNDRWSKHADMCLQYAECLKDNLMLDYKRKCIFF